MPLSLDGIKIDRDKMNEEWNNLLPFLNNIPFSQFDTSGFRYAFDNVSYSWGDGSILYAMLRSLQPRRYWKRPDITLFQVLYWPNQTYNRLMK